MLLGVAAHFRTANMTTSTEHNAVW